MTNSENMPRRKILAISGSTREKSANESILLFIAEKYHDQVDLDFYKDLTALPHFNPDLDNETVSPLVKDLRQQIAQSDGIIICTPEYVFSLPGALKNALEWTVSSTVFSDKPVALIVASSLGEKTFESLSLIMKTLGAKITEEGTLLVQGARSKIIDGQLTDEQTRKQIDLLMSSFLNSM